MELPNQNLPAPYVIGLTGNIAAGKSMVRKMLEAWGAVGIDTDTLGHRVLLPQGPGYAPVIERFGRGILDPRGTVDRSRLAAIVFRDPAALRALETIVHPPVLAALEQMLQESRGNVIVLESVVLFSSGQQDLCDTHWVVTSPRETRLERLVHQRGMTREAATARVDSQTPEEEKSARAQVVIGNEGSFEDTLHQAALAWELEKMDRLSTSTPLKAGKISVRPALAADVPALLRFASFHGTLPSGTDAQSWAYSRLFMLLEVEERLAGYSVWEMDNLLGLYQGSVLAYDVDPVPSCRLLVHGMEQECRRRLGEGLLASPQADHASILEEAGFHPAALSALPLPAWQDLGLKLVGTAAGGLFKPFLNMPRLLT